MKYKTGDMVLIKDIDWYHENKEKDGRIYLPFHPKPFYRFQDDYVVFRPEMALECGTVLTISFVIDGLYKMKGVRYAWTDDMIERLATESEKESLVSDKFKSNEIADLIKEQEKINEEMIKEAEEYDKRMERMREFYKGEQWPTEFECPDGYEFRDEKGNVIEAKKIVLGKKKTWYPKSYRACLGIMGYHSTNLMLIGNPEDYAKASHEEKKFTLLTMQFWRLLVCRDAYWKIAGEEMGFGKPWSINPHIPCHYMVYLRPEMELKKLCGCLNGPAILAFPTKEMRDAFYENFKELIEECKELL